MVLRGLSLWRDVNDLPLGGLSEPEIRRGIDQSDAFILYVTPRTFASDVIWRVEVPRAIARARRAAAQGERYPIVPVLRGVSVRELRHRCVAAGCAELPLRNAAFVPLHRRGRATKRARRAAFADVARRLLRALLASDRSARLAIVLRTFSVPARPARLDVNWTDAVDGADVRVWVEELLPALRDLRDELAHAHRRKLSLSVHARLSAALLAGLVFPLASGFDIVVSGSCGPVGRRASWCARAYQRRSRIGAASARCAGCEPRSRCSARRDGAAPSPARTLCAPCPPRRPVPSFRSAASGHVDGHGNR